MNKQGFTLVEVLLAISILGFASVFLFRAFFTSLSAIHYAQIRLSLVNDINNNLAHEKIALINDRIDLPVHKQRTIKIGNDEMLYDFSLDKVFSEGIIASGDIDYQWNEGQKTINVKKDFIWKTKIDEKYKKK
ncbi:MAG: type II secretion system protein [Candidatus Omnitrophica bacterium]|nr:type II secretion system protein [Candidatus Omnitrophota bacterium]